MSLTLGGTTYSVPGAYSITKIINQGGNAIPVFNIGVLIANSMSMRPYLLGVGSTPAETADQFILPFSDADSLARAAGNAGDSEMVTAFQYAKKTGGGTIYCLNVRPLTAMTGGVVANATPVTAFTVKTTEKMYGVTANDTSLTIAASVHTIIPPKNVTMLTANSGTTSATISVNQVPTGIRVGDIYFLVSNTVFASVAGQSMTVVSWDATAKTITFSAASSLDCTTAGYARIFQADTDNQEVSSSALTTVALVQAFYAASKYASVTMAAGITLMPVTLAKTYLQQLGSATPATAPAATASDWQAIVSNFQRWNEEFALVNKAYMRVLNLITSDSANHASFSALAVSMRAISKPIACIAGAALGETPAQLYARTFALNTDAFQLAGNGLDGLGAYLSYSPEIFGIRISNAITHNQTNDLIVATTVEVAYYQESTTLETLCNNGVMAIKVSKNGYQIAQGLTTYQNHTNTFNPDTKMTYLVTLRDLADFDLRLMLELLDQFAGADGVTREVLSSAIVQSSELEQNQLQYITGYQIQSITKTGNAWTIQRSVTLAGITDFIGLVNSIIVN